MSKLQGRRKNFEMIEKCLADKAWADARRHIQDELICEPTDHWLWFSLGLTYYEEKAYDKALACSRTAVELHPGCPLALWHYAGSLYMSSREHLAFVIWIRLLDMDIEEVAFGEHGEGMDWALQLINDVHFKLAKYYQWAGKADQAVESARKYVHNRNHGVDSIFDIKDAESMLPKPVARKRNKRGAGETLLPQ